MIRRLNFTQRRRINREHIEISLGQGLSGGLEFDASLDLSSYDLPSEANIFIEAYRRTTVMRFAAGTIDAVELPEIRDLSPFGRPDGLLFRVKVSSPGPDRGKLLAEADRIGFRRQEESTEEQIPLMPVQAADLGSLVWRVDFTDEPVLLVNEKLGDWRDVVRSESFITLVLPEALRQVLTRIWIIDKTVDDDDDYETWQSKWVRFTKEFPGIDSPPDSDTGQSTVEQWIEDVVRTFSDATGMLGRFTTFWAREEDK